MLRKLLSEVGNIFVGGRPVRAACITVEYQRTRFQCRFEFFLTECNCLVMVVRTYNFELDAVAHRSPVARAIRRCAGSVSLVNLDGSASWASPIFWEAIRICRNSLRGGCALLARQSHDQAGRTLRRQGGSVILLFPGVALVLMWLKIT
jgi:hypothetical protein